MSEITAAPAAAVATPVITPEQAAAAAIAATAPVVPVAAPVIPVAAAPIAAPAAVVPAATATPVAVPVVEDLAQPNDPNFMRSRLERAQTIATQKVLQQIGVTTPEEAKLAVEAARKAADAGKTTEQRLTEQTAQLAAAHAVINAQANNMLSVLTPEQKASVDSLVPTMRAMGATGSEAQMQLAAINALSVSWAKPVAAPVVATPAAQTPLAPAATTAAPPGAPPATAPGSPPNHAAIYASAATKNPFAAAAFGIHNPSVYAPKT